METEAEKRAEAKIKQKLVEISPLGVKARQTQKQENLEKILKLAQKKDFITRKEVEYKLKISRGSATNYLRTLVSQNKLKEEGEASNKVFRLVQ